VVHLLRASHRYVTWSDRKAVAKELRPVYAAVDARAAEAAVAGQLHAISACLSHQKLSPFLHRRLANGLSSRHIL